MRKKALFRLWRHVMYLQYYLEVLEMLPCTQYLPAQCWCKPLLMTQPTFTSSGAFNHAELDSQRRG
jgi:hypothetical protein